MLHENEANQALMFYFDNATPDKSWFVMNIVCFILLWIRAAVFMNATRRDRNLPLFASKEK